MATRQTGEIISASDINAIEASISNFINGSLRIVEGPLTQAGVDAITTPGNTILEQNGTNPDGSPRIVNVWVKTSA